MGRVMRWGVAWREGNGWHILYVYYIQSVFLDAIMLLLPGDALDLYLPSIHSVTYAQSIFSNAMHVTSTSNRRL